MTSTETIVYSNKPGHVLPILEEELSDFRSEAQEFMAGDVEELVFQADRLRMGTYGQRQPDVHMLRIKLPMGTVTADQLDAFGEVADRFAPLRKGHITTRQNIQMHHIPLAKANDALETLAKAGLSTREACGNVVRNVTGDPWAGINEHEPFDPTPYAGAYARYWLRNPLTQKLPRKFKVAFASHDVEDPALTQIHDMGFIPRVVDGQKGFEMRIGGGLSIMARNAFVLSEFVSVDEYLKVAEAALRIFDRSDELRKNRQKARIKFLVHRVGIEEFRRMVDEELKGDWAQGDFSPDPYLFTDDEESRVQPKRDSYEQPSDEDKDAFFYFITRNVKRQRQQGFSTVEVKVTRGDLDPDQFRGLANVLRDYTVDARTSVQQNLVLRWVRDESLYEVFKALRELDLADAGANRITDVVSCPGTDSCKLGITSSMGLNRAIQERVESMDIQDELTQSMHIKMSGCPNSCGMHHLGDIGFHGAVMKVDGHQLPAYHMFAGGRYDNGELVLGTQLKVRIPAKRTPDVVERLVRKYEKERNDGEIFHDYFNRVGPKHIEAAIEDLTLPGEFTEENKSMFIDWTKLDLYVMERGEGECAV